MPIYEYECTKCGKTFEIFQKIADEPLTSCRVCQGPLAKLMSQCSFHLKGTGWYVTDYKKPADTVGGNKRKEKEESAETKTETPQETKPEPKAESKTETKTETKSTQQTGG